jgi:hypothetical protein
MRIVFLFFFITIAVITPAVAFGGPFDQIVPKCSDTAEGCNLKDLITLGENVLNFVLALAVTVSAVMFAWAGFLYITSAGNEQKVGHAKTLFAAVIIGLIIILTAWLVVDTLLKALTGRGLKEGVKSINYERVIDTAEGIV